VAFAGALGAPGLFLISFLDSSVLTFPVINDLLLIELSIQHPARMPLYALMASLGSVLGCVLLYFIARKGGEAYFRRKAGARAEVIKHWVERNGFGGMLVAALLPPPTPFKFFVFAAGVFEVPLISYVAAISLARLIRYFGVGYLAVKYGNDALPFLARHKVQVVIFLVIFVAVSYLASRWILRARPRDGKV
jgi:membrane protein YqaA with SNARE-associated domain